MTTKKITKSLLVAGGVMLASSCISVQSSLAVDGNLPAFLTQSATALDVTVSDRVTFNIPGGSNNAAVSNIRVTNNLHAAPIIVSGIQAAAAEGYSLESYDTDFSAFAIDSGHFAIAYTGEQSDGEDISGEGLAIEEEIAAAAQKEFTFAGKSSSYSTTIAAEDNARIANIILTVGLKEAQTSDPEPDEPLLGAVLDTGRNVNSKLKKMAGAVCAEEDEEYFEDDEYYEMYRGICWDSDETITTINRSTALPDDFTATDENTISAVESLYPVYAWLDSDVIYYYTAGTSVVMSPDSSYTFQGMQALQSVDGISDWDTSNVTNMTSMFSNAGFLATTFSLDLSGWDTSNVTSMSSMFSQSGYKNATSWSVGDLSGWNTSNVTDMSGMFYATGEKKVTSTWSVGDLSNWDTSKVTNMRQLFSQAGRNAEVWSVGDLSNWDTSNVTDMGSMFHATGENAATWSIGDLSGWDTSNVTNMSYMFQAAGRNAEVWSIGNLSNWNTSSLRDITGMFASAGQNATVFALDLSNWDTSKVNNMSTVFIQAGSGATSFTLNLSNWNTSNVSSMTYMFLQAGYNATNWEVTIPANNGNGINNTASKQYGKTTSVSVSPDSGRSFTLAQ